MNLDLGVLGKVEMEEMDRYNRLDEGTITHSGFTAMGIRVHVFEGNGRTSSFTHGELWRNSILIDKKIWEEER